MLSTFISIHIYPKPTSLGLSSLQNHSPNFLIMLIECLQLVPCNSKLTFLKVICKFPVWGCAFPVSKIVPLFSKSGRQETFAVFDSSISVAPHIESVAMFVTSEFCYKAVCETVQMATVWNYHRLNQT